MNSRILGVLGVVCLVGLAAACGGQKEAPTSKPGAASGATTAVAAGDFGVPECDAFMRKYIACIDSKVPEMARGPMKQAFDQQKVAWQQAASNPQTKAALSSACTQAEAAAKQSTAAYGCQW